MDRGWQPAVKAAKLLRTLDERIDPAHTALVLIDVQNDFCDERGAAGQRGEAIEMIKATVPRIRTLLDWARRADAMVIHVKAEYGAMTRHVGAPHRFPGATREGAVWTASAAEIDPAGGFAEGATEVCRAGTRGAAFVDGIVPQGAEQVVIKHRFSGFTDTRLDLLLRSNGIKTIVVAGVTTNCCVESTVRDAAMRDFYIVVAADGVATKDMHEAAHRASLETMGIYFAQVRPSAEIIESWRKHAATGLRATA
ncbi:MAG: isochorismatase family cysteine hydrolase [Pseudomonadota bacterium]